MRAYRASIHMHEEPTHFKLDDEAEVVKAGSSHKSAASKMSVGSLAGDGWSRSRRGGGGGDSSWYSSARGTTSGSMPHTHKALLLLIGGAVVLFVRKWLRSTGATRRPAASGTVKLGGADDAFARKGGLNFSPKDETFKKMSLT